MVCNDDVLSVRNQVVFSNSKPNSFWIHTFSIKIINTTQGEKCRKLKKKCEDKDRYNDIQKHGKVLYEPMTLTYAIVLA